MANHNSTKKSFYLNGQLLRLILKSKGITQQALADIVGIGKNTIYRAVNFNRMENKENFEKICSYLEIDPIVLLDPDFLNEYLKSKNEQIEKIDMENISQYITIYGKGFRSYSIHSFSDEYILKFFENSAYGQSLSPEQKAFFFSKIIDAREIFIGLIYDFFDTRDENDVYPEDFYKKFVSWFDRNIKNKGLNE